MHKRVTKTTDILLDGFVKLIIPGNGKTAYNS